MALTRLDSMRDFFRIWFAWKIQAAIAFIFIVGIVMLFSYVYTPDYKSKAKILILPRTSEEVVISAGESENRILPVSLQDINTEIELLTSDEVIKDTVRSFMKGGLLKGSAMGLKVQDDAWYGKIVDSIKRTINKILLFLRLKERSSPFDSNVVLLRNSIEVEPVAMSNIILISLKSERPKASSIVLNRLLETYVTKHNNAFTKEEGIQFYNQQAMGYHNKLEAGEKKLKEFQQRWNIVDLNRQRETNINLLAELARDLKYTELAYNEVKSNIAIFREDMARNEQDIVVTKEMRTITSVIELEKSIVPLLVKRTEMLKSFNPSSRVYQDLEGQIEALRGEVRAEIIKAIKTDELELKTLRVKQESLSKQLAKLQEETSILNQRERILKNLEREVTLLENNYILYASKTEDARIYGEQKKQDLANIYITDNASLPVKPTFPNRMLMLIASVIIGFFAALGTPFLLEFLDHRLKTPGEVEDLLSLPVVCFFTEES